MRMILAVVVVAAVAVPTWAQERVAYNPTRPVFTISHNPLDVPTAAPATITTASGAKIAPDGKGGYRYVTLPNEPFREDVARFNNNAGGWSSSAYDDAGNMIGIVRHSTPTTETVYPFSLPSTERLPSYRGPNPYTRPKPFTTIIRSVGNCSGGVCR